MQQPKMFTNMLRQGMGKEMQVKISNTFNTKLNMKVKQALAKQRKIEQSARYQGEYNEMLKLASKEK